MSEKPNPQLTEISVKLDRVTKLLALNIVKDMTPQKAQVAFLSDAGFPPKEIANVLSTSSGSVRVALHAIRKERGVKESETEDKGVSEQASIAEASKNE